MIGILPFFSIMIAYVEDVEFILKNIFLLQEKAGATGGIRTHTLQILSLLPASYWATVA